MEREETYVMDINAGSIYGMHYIQENGLNGNIDVWWCGVNGRNLWDFEETENPL